MLALPFLHGCFSKDPQVDIIMTRPLSLLERFSCIPVITRTAHTITYLFQYTPTTLPSTALLHERVAKVQQEVHHLWSEVIDGDTPRPYLQLRPTGPWAVGEIVREDQYDAGNEKDGLGEKQGTSAGARLLEQEIARMRGRVADEGPAWQVTRYLPTASTSICYIAISAYHHTVDGTGGLRLCLILLSDYPIVPAPGLAPLMEDIIPTTPSLPYLIKLLFKHRFAPRLPARFRPKACWPGEKVNGNPTLFPEAQSTLHLPPALISALKQAGKANRVSTLHPIIETALVLALYAVMGGAGTMLVGTPVNERVAGNPTHPQIASNFLSSITKSHSHLHTYKDITSPGFWAPARGTAAHHSSRSARSHARYGIGILRHIPDPESFSSPHSENPDRRTKTGWEEFFWSGTERPAPYHVSMVVSNLGMVKALPVGCQGMLWSQSACPFGQAVSVSLVGHEMGLEVCVGFADGCAINADEVERVLQRFKEILESLIKDQSL